MEICIYFANLKRLSQVEDSLRVLDPQRIPAQFRGLLFERNPGVYEESANLMSSYWMSALRERGMEITRLYFGQEFCQNLIPTPEEVEQAFYFSRQYEWDFTYVTGGYLTEVGIEKVLRNLARLRTLDPEAEVVVNDWGMIRQITKNYPQFHLVLGRILNKQTRLNLFMTPGNPIPVFMDKINTDEQTIRNNQLRAYSDISLSNQDYLKFLKSLGFNQVDLDMVPQGVLRPEDGWGMTLGYYFPWAFIATGRNCPTAGVKEIQRSLMMTDRQCGRPCQRYNCSPDLINYEHMVLQRGPALFSCNSDTFQNYFESDVIYERLIYEPYLPI